MSSWLGMCQLALITGVAKIIHLIVVTCESFEFSEFWVFVWLFLAQKLSQKLDVASLETQKILRYWFGPAAEHKQKVYWSIVINQIFAFYWSLYNCIVLMLSIVMCRVIITVFSCLPARFWFSIIWITPPRAFWWEASLSFIVLKFSIQ
jgi:hypothetical protein